MALINLIEKELGRPTAKAAFIARYTGGVGHEKRKSDEISKLKFLGLQLPVIRSKLQRILLSDSYLNEVAKLSKSKTNSPEVAWPLWVKTFQEAQIFEVRSMAFMWMGQKKLKELRHAQAQDLLQLAELIDNWALSDSLSEMLAQVLEANPKEFWPTYLAWNKSKNPWLRRQSLVGIYNYARFRQKPIPPKKALPLVKARLQDPHFYVQRGVGWTLREIDRVDSGMQRAFVAQHVLDLHPVAWFAATELYPQKLRLQLVKQRRSG